MPILHIGKTIALEDASECYVDETNEHPIIRFHGNFKGGLVIRAYPRANSDGLIVLSADDRRALRDWLNEEGD